MSSTANRMPQRRVPHRRSRLCVEALETRDLMTAVITPIDLPVVEDGRYGGLSLSDTDFALFRIYSSSSPDQWHVWSASGGLKEVEGDEYEHAWLWVDDHGDLTSGEGSRQIGGENVLLEEYAWGTTVANSRGDVVGLYAGETPPGRGYSIWPAGSTMPTVHVDATLGPSHQSNYSEWGYTALSNDGRVAGYSRAENGAPIPLTYVGGVRFDLPSPDPLPSRYYDAVPIAINSNGWIVGVAESDSGSYSGGVVWKPVFGGYEAQFIYDFRPVGISDTNIVAGVQNSGNHSGVLWSEATGSVELQSLLPETDYAEIDAINARGDLLLGNTFTPRFYLVTGLEFPPPEPDLAAVDLKWNTASDVVDVTYKVEKQALDKDTTVALFWATGSTIETILGAPAWTTNADHATGTHGPIHVNAQALGTPPLGAKKLLLVLNKEKTVEESDSTNNIFAIDLPKPDLVAKVLRHTTLAEANHGPLAIRYEVHGPVTADTTVALYWSKDSSFSPTSVIGPAIYPVNSFGYESRTVDRSIGAHGPFFFPAVRVLSRPAGATTMLVVVDPPSKAHPTGLVDEQNETNNVLPIKIDALLAKNAPQASTEGYPNFTVAQGQFTFDVEGVKGKDGGPGQTRAPHWPGGVSGVTIGRGYDLKTSLLPPGVPETSRASSERKDLIAADVDPKVADELVKGAGLSGQAAQTFVFNHPFTEITPSEQFYLFNHVYARYVADEKRIDAGATLVKTYGAVDWSKLDPRIKAILIDMRYLGEIRPELRKYIQPYITTTAGKKDGKGDFAGFKASVLNPSHFATATKDPRRYRMRKDFLDGKS